MRSRVFVKVPELWKELLPEDLHHWCGRAVRLDKALYGYTFSGKFLYEDQSEFFENECGLRTTPFPGLWTKLVGDDKMLQLLQYSDDMIAASNCLESLADFAAKIQARFNVEVKPIADWFLQARIRVDADGNVLLDQQRYSKAIVRRYLPSYPAECTEQDSHRYRSPLPHTMKWTKDDNSKNMIEVSTLQHEFGFNYREVVGSLIYLGNTAIEELFGIQKTCRHMNLPGRRHFQAVSHLLHHLRCHPTNALIFYKNAEDSPVVKMLRERIGIPRHIDLSFIYFTDSSFMDCDEGRSTASYIGFFQGGAIDHNSFVPLPVANSTAEAETNALAAGTMAAAYTRRGIADILYNNEDKPWTVPIFSDSEAAIAMNSSEKVTKKSRHIERRWFYAKQEYMRSRVIFFHVRDQFSLADLGTKNLTAEEAKYKLSHIEVPVNDFAILRPTIPDEPRGHKSKKGVDKNSTV